MSGDLRSFLTKGYRDLGPVFGFSAFSRRFIGLVGPEASRFVQKQGRLYLRSYETWRDFNGVFGAKDALMGMDGPGHFRMRKLHSSAFSQTFIEGRLDDVIGIIRRVIADWPRKRPIAAHYAMQRLFVEQIVLLTTGVSALDYVDPLIDVSSSLLKVHVMRQRPAWILRLPRNRRALKRMDELYALVMERHRGVENSPPDLIDNLLELHGNDPLFFSEADMKIAVLGPFFAGIETVASTSAFMLYAVLKDPELLARVRAEANWFFGSGTPSAERLHTLDVTRRVVLETLRMYPVAPGLSRRVANSFDFGGHTVPAGADVIVGCTVTHHLPEFFPNPECFDIERYAPERAEHEQPGVFAPFGLGTHRCLGSRFAESQMAVTLLTIVREVEIALHPPGYELKVKHAPTPHPSPSFQFHVRG